MHKHLQPSRRSCRRSPTRYGNLTLYLRTTETAQRPARHTTVLSSGKGKDTVILSTSDYQTNGSRSTVTAVSCSSTQTVRHPRNKQGSNLSQAHQKEQNSDLPPSTPTGIMSRSFPTTCEYLCNRVLSLGYSINTNYTDIYE